MQLLTHLSMNPIQVLDFDAPENFLTPHIGAATNEAQDRIGIELAEQIIELLNN